MDLALSLAYAGYHLWKNRSNRYRIKPSRPQPYLLNIPPEIRLIIYEFLFQTPETTHDTTISQTPSTAQFLEPLLTCRLMYEEAHAYAFQHANFYFSQSLCDGPYLNPRLLQLPAHKVKHVRRLWILWRTPHLSPTVLRRLFSEIQHAPLHLSQLTFLVLDLRTLEAFRFKYALFFPLVREFGAYITGELPLLQNVQRIVLPSPGVVHKRTWQHLFDPEKPALAVMDTAHGPTVEATRKPLGRWKYEVRRAEEVGEWRLELSQPGPKGGKKRKREEETRPSKKRDSEVSVVSIADV
jgi:hypothetical protein